MKLIPLTQGFAVKVDDSDYDWLSHHKWYARRKHRAPTYASRKGNRPGETVLMHRVILGALRGQIVDHANGDGLDNRRSNLRIATVSQNLTNSHHAIKSASGFHGVTWHRQQSKWQAQIKANGRSHYLGLFGTREEAAGAYNAAAVRLHGTFARLNAISVSEKGLPA